MNKALHYITCNHNCLELRKEWWVIMGISEGMWIDVGTLMPYNIMVTKNGVGGRIRY